MEHQEHVKIKRQNLIALVVALFLVILASQPVANGLEKILGVGAHQWVMNIVLIFVIFFFTFFRKHKKEK